MAGVYDPPYPIPYNPIQGTTSAPAGVMTVYNVKDNGAYGDGVHDDTAAIQAALTAANGAGGTVWFPPGTYLMSGITFLDLTKVTFAGVYGASTIKLSQLATQFQIYGAQHVRFEGLSFDQAGFDASSIITDTNAVDVVSHNCQFLNCMGAAFFTANANGGAFTPGIMADKLRFDNNVVIASSSQVRDLVVLMSNNGKARGNHINSYGGNALALYEADASLAASNSIHLNGAGGIGINIASSTRSAATGNTVYGSTSDKCYSVGQEQDNGSSARSQTDALFAGNVASITPGATNAPSAYKLFNASSGTIINGGSCVGVHEVIYNDGTNDATIEGVQVVSMVSSFVNNAYGTYTLAIRNCPGYNPVGSAVPGTAFALPASGTAWTNNTGVDGTLFVTAAGTVTDVVVQGVTVGSSLAVGQSFFVPAGGTFTLTYSAAPTLVFVGN